MTTSVRLYRDRDRRSASPADCSATPRRRRIRVSRRATTISSGWPGCSKTPGYRQRFTVRPLEWYLEPLGWPERNAAYLAGATQLFFDAAKSALDAAGVVRPTSIRS